MGQFWGVAGQSASPSKSLLLNHQIHPADATENSPSTGFEQLIRGF
ncbi:MAG: hypothetical protein NW237_00385 [Cyanobacteriota bacterium]|nr:hypothetical protein [Cyanobacteriota bacterium]